MLPPALRQRGGAHRDAALAPAPRCTRAAPAWDEAAPREGKEISAFLPKCEIPKACPIARTLSGRSAPDPRPPSLSHLQTARKISSDTPLRDRVPPRNPVREALAPGCRRLP